MWCLKIDPPAVNLKSGKWQEALDLQLFSDGFTYFYGV